MGLIFTQSPGWDLHVLDQILKRTVLQRKSFSLQRSLKTFINPYKLSEQVEAVPKAK